MQTSPRHHFPLCNACDGGSTLHSPGSDPAGSSAGDPTCISGQASAGRRGPGTGRHQPLLPELRWSPGPPSEGCFALTLRVATAALGTGRDGTASHASQDEELPEPHLQPARDGRFGVMLKGSAHTCSGTYADHSSQLLAAHLAQTLVPNSLRTLPELSRCLQICINSLVTINSLLRRDNKEHS